MTKTLTQISQKLKDAVYKTKAKSKEDATESPLKIQLIYAFNGTGKTRLSREFKNLVTPKTDEENDDELGFSQRKVLYYNAFTEDLFYWDNGLESNEEPKLKIQPNLFTDWILKDQGQDQNIITYFQHYTDDKLTPKFDTDYKTITFSLERGDETKSGNIKISKGEESNFIWSVFYALLNQIIGILNDDESDDKEVTQFDNLEYVFIDDPVSSLDENNLIVLAVNLAELIKSSKSKLRFIITTHNPLFYNVLHNELEMSKTGKKEGCYLLEKLEDGTFELNTKYGDSNRNFSYHLHLKQIIEKADKENAIERFHFTLLRNLYEKTASFLGYQKWSDLLPNKKKEDQSPYYKRIIQFMNHNTLSGEAVTEPSPEEKKIIGVLLKHLKEEYSYKIEEEKTNG